VFPDQSKGTPTFDFQMEHPVSNLIFCSYLDNTTWLKSSKSEKWKNLQGGQYFRRDRNTVCFLHDFLIYCIIQGGP